MQTRSLAQLTVWTRRAQPLALCVAGLIASAQGTHAHPQPSAADPLPHHGPDVGVGAGTVIEATHRAEVVAQFAEGRVTVGELEDAIQSQNPFMQQRYLSTAAVQALLDRSLRFELLAAEAERRGYGQRPEVQMALKQSAVQTLIRQDYDEKITTQSISAADVQTYYNTHVDEFVRGEGRRASQLSVADEATAQTLLTQAKAADTAAFRELVRANSVDQTNKQRGGDLPYFTATGHAFDEGDATMIDPAVAKAAFALRNVGDTSAVVKTANGFAIVKLTGIRPAQDVTLTQADERVRSRLWRERRQAAIDDTLNRLKTQLKVVVHPELVDAVKLETGPALPPNTGLPSGFPHTRAAAANAPSPTVPDTH